MKLAEGSRRRIEAFFREALDDENFRLPAIYFHGGKFSALLTGALKIHGITIGKNIFVVPKLVFRTSDDFNRIGAELAAHEIAHVVQYEREGFVKFLYKYFRSYRQNLRAKKISDAASRHEAYLEIPYEIEARALAAEFVEWNDRHGSDKIKRAAK